VQQALSARSPRYLQHHLGLEAPTDLLLCARDAAWKSLMSSRPHNLGGRAVGEATLEGTAIFRARCWYEVAPAVCHHPSLSSLTSHRGKLFKGTFTGDNEYEAQGVFERTISRGTMLAHLPPRQGANSVGLFVGQVLAVPAKTGDIGDPSGRATGVCAGPS